MARSEARIFVDIWSDPDFRALSHGAQWTFMFLISQRDLAHDGVIALRETRWARSAENLTEEKLSDDLDELHEARFIVIDREEQELLIRSFIRRDKVHRQPNVLRSAADHLALVSSPVIRHALAVELARIAESDEVTDTTAPMIAEMRAALPSPGVFAVPDPSGNPTEEGCQLRPGDRGITTAVTNKFPLPLDPEKILVSEPPPKARRLDAYADENFQAFWNAYPKKVGKRAALRAWKAALSRHAKPADIIAAAQRYRDDPKRSRDRGYIKNPEGWLNAERYNDPPPEVEQRASGGWWDN